MRWSEVSPDLTHDWFPDSNADWRDTFVELQAIGVSLDLEGWAVRLSNGATVLATVTIGRPALTAGSGFYVVWGQDFGVAVPSSGTVELLNPAGTVVISRTWYGIATGQAENWNGAAWASQLATPGQAYDYWETNPVPTDLP